MIPFLTSRKEKEKEEPPFLTSRKSPKSRAEQFAGCFFRAHDCLLQLGTSLSVSFEVPGQSLRPLFVSFKVFGKLGRHP